MKTSKIYAHDYGIKTLYCYNDINGSTRTMSEGDIYYITGGNCVVQFVWGDLSEQIFNDSVWAFKNLEDALKASNAEYTYYMDGSVEKNF